MSRGEGPFLAIGSRLRGVPEVHTLGLRPNFLDYSPRERRWMAEAEMILYPTLNYAQFFTTLGKRIFPSLETYLYADEKIKQTTLYYMLGIPHPRTRFYYHLHYGDILRDYRFPFVAKLARFSAQGKGVFLITSSEDMERYIRRVRVAYIQEFLPHRRDLRVILVNYRPILAYWRERTRSSFKTNLAQGGTIHYDGIPEEAVHLAREWAMKCRFDDVGLDLIRHDGQWYLIEANMKYGRKGLMMKGMNLKEILREMLLSGEIPAGPYL
ncbi:MAG: RimK family alpha-L-glutamate ligase [Deltaproteobacteria bacterium]|nr:RimK family alpha-L-glutamate ligase [Deltaproteobacteria bacterium]